MLIKAVSLDLQVSEHGSAQLHLGMLLKPQWEIKIFKRYSLEYIRRGEWYHQDCNKGHSWLYFLSQRELTTIYGQDNTERILQHERDDEIPHCTTETNTDCITKAEQLRTHRVASPPGQHSIIPRNIHNLMVPTVEKEPSMDVHLLQHCGLPLGSLHSCLTPQACRGICRAQPLGIWMWWRRGVEVQNVQHSDPSRLSSYQ